MRSSRIPLGLALVLRRRRARADQRLARARVPADPRLCCRALGADRVFGCAPEIARTLAWGAPAAVGLALALGAYYHGPGRTYDSWAGGDIAFYAGRIAAARHSLFPFPDLAAAGHHFTYAEIGPSLVGAALSWLPGFDPFLFGATTLPLVGMLSVLVGFALLERPVEPRWTDVLVVTTLAVSMTSYGSWLVESSPVALAVPLVFPMYALYRRALTLPRLIGATAVLAFLCVCLKVLMLLPLAVLVGAAVLRDHRRALAGRRGALLAGGLVVVAAAVVVTLFATAGSFGDLVHLRVSTWRHGAGRRDVSRTSYAPGGPALFLVGAIVLAVALARERRYALVVAVALPTLLMQFVDGINFEIAVDAAVFAAALDLWVRPARRRAPFVAAGALLAAAVVASATSRRCEPAPCSRCSSPRSWCRDWPRRFARRASTARDVCARHGGRVRACRPRRARVRSAVRRRGRVGLPAVRRPWRSHRRRGGRGGDCLRPPSGRPRSPRTARTSGCAREPPPRACTRRSPATTGRPGAGSA